MPQEDGFGFTLTVEGLAIPEEMSRLHPWLALDAMEDALKAGARVYARAFAAYASARGWRSLSGYGRGGAWRVLGSKYVRYLPSARVIGPPHVHLLEAGHRVFGPPRGRRNPLSYVSAGGIGFYERRANAPRYVDTGKRTDPQRFRRTVILGARAKANAEVMRWLTNKMNRLVREVETGEYSKQSRSRLSIFRQKNRLARQNRRDRFAAASGTRRTRARRRTRSGRRVRR